MKRTAQEFDRYRATTIVLFNPFGLALVEAVLAQIKRSRTSPPMRIAYVNPF
jgi:hypothetical protein